MKEGRCWNSVNMSLLPATTLQCLGGIFLNEDIHQNSESCCAYDWNSVLAENKEKLQSLNRDECSPTPDLHNPPGMCL